MPPPPYYISAGYTPLPGGSNLHAFQLLTTSPIQQLLLHRQQALQPPHRGALRPYPKRTLVHGSVFFVVGVTDRARPKSGLALPLAAEGRPRSLGLWLGGSQHCTLNPTPESLMYPKYRQEHWPLRWCKHFKPGSGPIEGPGGNRTSTQKEICSVPMDLSLLSEAIQRRYHQVLP